MGVVLDAKGDRAQTWGGGSGMEAKTLSRNLPGKMVIETRRGKASLLTNLK